MWIACKVRYHVDVSVVFLLPLSIVRLFRQLRDEINEIK